LLTQVCVGHYKVGSVVLLTVSSRTESLTHHRKDIT